MRAKFLVAILALLALTLPISPAHAAGVVTVCDEAHLRAALAGGGTVTFECSGTITLTTEIVILADTTIDGNGQSVTISGNDAVRVFAVNAGVSFKLNRLSVANGKAVEGGGVYNNGTMTVRDSIFSGNNADRYGGGIYNNGGRVTVSNSTFSGNHSALSGGGMHSLNGTLIVTNSAFIGNSAYDLGGGIHANGGTLTVNSSTFSDNSAHWGGGIYNTGGVGVTVSNSTFSGNSAYGGGGIRSTYGGTLTVSNSTFSDNTAGSGGGIAHVHSLRLSVSNSTFSGNGSTSPSSSIFIESGAVLLKNTIVANSQGGRNCFGVFIDGGGNLSYPDTTCPGINADPVLGPLQDNGGPTETMALGPGSAAIDAGNDAICAASPVNNLDQRGVTRPQGSHCDIGAVEQILDPSAVSLGTLSVQSAPGAFPPTLVFGLLLVALMSIGAFRRVRPMR